MSFDLGSARGSISLEFDPKPLEAAKKALIAFQKQSAEASKAIQADFKKMADSMKSAGQTLSLSITAPLTIGAGIAIKAASDLNETLSATRTVFGDAADEVIRFSETSARSLGLSQEAALSAAVQYAGLGKQAGLTGADLADFSEQLIQNSADLASFYNTDPSQALDALRSGLIGESEPLRRYNILLSEADVQQKALQAGLAATTGEITTQDKVMARYLLIQEQMGASANDFQRTSDGTANSLRIAKAELIDTAAAFGQELLPAVTQGIKILTDVVRVFKALPQPVKQAVIAIAAIAAVVGPALLAVGAIVGIGAAAAAAGIPLAALAIAAGGVAAVLGGGTALAALANHIQDTDKAAAEAKDPVDSLTESIAKLNAEAGETATKFQADSAIKEWQKLTAAIDETEQARAEAEQALNGQSFTAPGATGLDSIAPSINAEANNRAAQAQVELDALDKINLTQEDRVHIEHDINTILNQQGDLRARNVAELGKLLTYYNEEQALLVRSTQQWKNGEITQEQYLEIQRSLKLSSADLVQQIDALSRSQDDLAGSTGDVNAGLAESIKVLDGTAQAAKTYQALSTKPAGHYWYDTLQKIKETRAELIKYGEEQQRLAAADFAAKTETTPPGFTPGAGSFDEAAATRNEVARQAQERIALDREVAAHRKDLERETADDIKQINRDLQDTLKDLNKQREQNNRDMQRSLVQLERDTAQQSRQLAAQRNQAIADANSHLADLAEQRADNELDLQKRLADAQEAAGEQYADLADRRVEIEQDAAKRVVDAEAQATEQLADLAKRRRETEKEAAVSIADSRAQTAEALAGLADRESGVRSTLAESLRDAQAQYNDALHDMAAAQAEVRQNLQGQLSDLTEAWHQQAKDLQAREKEIRGDLSASLREMRAGWSKLNAENLNQQKQLHGAMQDTLAQNTLTAQQMQDDLQRIQADPTYTDAEKADAAFRTPRALEALALDRQLAEQKGEREIASLEDERRKQQEEYEAERATAVEQAQRDLRNLNRDRMQAEKQYHDRRIELENDAASRIAELNGQRKDAINDLASAQADAQRKATDALADIANDRVQITDDAAKRELDIRKGAASQIRDLADQELGIREDLAGKLEDIANGLAKQTSDLARDELDIANGLAKQQQTLRDEAAGREQDLADRERGIQEDLGTRLADIEHQKAIVVRNEAREREGILREHANEAEKIARAQGKAETAAWKDEQDARDTLAETIQKERLGRATGQGEEIGKAQADGEIAGLESKKGPVGVAGTALSQAALTGIGEAHDNFVLAGENMVTSLISGLTGKLKDLEDAGKAVAKAAEDGAKKQAEIASPSKVFGDLGRNMRQSLAAELAAGNETELAARSAVARAAQAANDELSQRRRLKGTWATGAEQARRQQQQELTIRQGQLGGRWGGGLGSQILHLTLEMDGQVLERKVVEVTANGVRGALHRNPLTRRRV